MSTFRMQTPVHVEHGATLQEVARALAQRLAVLQARNFQVVKMNIRDLESPPVRRKPGDAKTRAMIYEELNDSGWDDWPVWPRARSPAGGARSITRARRSARSCGSCSPRGVLPAVWIVSALRRQRAGADTYT